MERAPSTARDRPENSGFHRADRDRPDRPAGGDRHRPEGGEGVGGRRRALRLVPFVLAPALMAANGLWHPDDGTGLVAYNSVAAAPGRWYLVHVVGALGGALAVFAGRTIAVWAAARGARLLRVAGWCMAVGAFGFVAEQVGHGLLLSALVAAEVGPDAAAPAWDEFVTMPETVAVGLLTGVFLLGVVLLAVGLLRRPGLPKWWGASLLAFIVASMAAQTAGPVWLLFGVLFAVPMALAGRRIVADLPAGA